MSVTFQIPSGDWSLLLSFLAQNAKRIDDHLDHSNSWKPHFDLVVLTMLAFRPFVHPEKAKAIVAERKDHPSASSTRTASKSKQCASSLEDEAAQFAISTLQAEIEEFLPTFKGTLESLQRHANLSVEANKRAVAVEEMESQILALKAEQLVLSFLFCKDQRSEILSASKRSFDAISSSPLKAAFHLNNVLVKLITLPKDRLFVNVALDSLGTSKPVTFPVWKEDDPRLRARVPSEFTPD